MNCKPHNKHVSKLKLVLCSSRREPGRKRSRQARTCNSAYKKEGQHVRRATVPLSNFELISTCQRLNIWVKSSKVASSYS